MKNNFKKKTVGICSAAPNFFKGIIVGVGAIAPGLSGSILLIIFGLYHKIVNAISTIFKNFKKNVLFLLPLFFGGILGIILFSKLIDFLLETFPMQTNYAFLGLILGTIPMVFKEVKKEGFRKKYYIFIAGAFALGTVFFFLNSGLFPDVLDPNFFQSVLLGLVVSAAYLVPGVDSFAILSTFGLYNLWIKSIAAFDFSVLLPAAIGLAVGAVVISLIFNRLFTKWYTGTYSIIFGLFISVILNFIVNDIAKELPTPALNAPTVVSFVLLIVGFAASLFFSQLENIQKAVKAKKASLCADVIVDSPESISENGSENMQEIEELKADTVENTEA